MENLLTFGIALFTLVNPPGIMSVFLSMTQTYDPIRQRKTAIGTFFAVLVIMIIITWAGDSLLNFFGIRTSSLKVAGSIIIGMLGLSMIQEKKSDIKYSANKNHSPASEITHEINELDALSPVDITVKKQAMSDKSNAEEDDSIVVVPLSFPIIIGPGAISAIVAATAELPGTINRFYISAVCVIVALSLLVTLIFAVPIGKLLGKSGLSIMTKIMGMLLMAIAVEMFVSGITVLLPSLAS